MKWLLRIAIAFEKLIQIFHKPECDIVWSDIVKAQELLKDGDLLLSRVGYELSNLFIPGPYKHAAIYIDGWVFEATTHGVRKCKFEEWALKKDSIAAMRLPIENLPDGLKFLNDQLGEPYDYNFLETDSSSAWYCSIYAYRFFCISYPKFAEIFTFRKTLGENTVTPSDFWKSNKLMPVAKFN